MRRVSARLAQSKRGGAGVALLALAVACGPRTPARAPEGEAASEPAPAAPTAEGPTAEGPTAGAEQPESAAASAGDDGLDADIAELSASTRTDDAAEAPAQPEPREGGELRGRDIVYRVTPKGLVIEIDGLHLRPEAKVIPDKRGGYGVELRVHAESFDGRQFWVDTSREGPLSIAGKVQSKDGTVQRFAHERDGSGDERVILPDAPHTFAQRWPGRGQPKLRAGQTLTLEVGLWGVRVQEERERPVRRLFTVKMVAGPKAPAVIEPPAMDWGS